MVVTPASRRSRNLPRMRCHTFGYARAAAQAEVRSVAPVQLILCGVSTKIREHRPTCLAAVAQFKPTAMPLASGRHDGHKNVFRLASQACPFLPSVTATESALLVNDPQK